MLAGPFFKGDDVHPSFEYELNPSRFVPISSHYALLFSFFHLSISATRQVGR